MEERILVFNTNQHLHYWFAKICEFLNKCNPDLFFRFRIDEYILYGNFKFIFKTYKNNFAGYHNIPKYHDIEYKLENDFSNTLIEIMEGE